MGKVSREEEARANAAQRLLNRKRMGIECAIEALEAVGYEVRQTNFGSYKVSPPPVVEAPEPEPVVFEAVEVGFLDEYPAMLSPKEVSEIVGVTEASVRRMCKQNCLPSSKIGGRVRIPKEALASLMR